MISNRYSKAFALVIGAFLVLSAVAVPAASVNVANESVPDSKAVGEPTEATVTLDTLYTNPQTDNWTLQGSTELQNVTWIVTLRNPQGEQIYRNRFQNASFSLPDISTESQYGTVTKITVTVRGNTPAVDQYTYPQRENFTVMSLSQQPAGDAALTTIDTWTMHHFTSGGGDDPGSKQARQEIEQAKKAISNAEDAGADVSDAQNSLDRAISAYESGNFPNAVDLANEAENKADNARKQKGRNSQLLLIGGVIVLLVLVGGGFWYYRSQQDDYDKLG